MQKIKFHLISKLEEKRKKQRAQNIVESQKKKDLSCSTTLKNMKADKKLLEWKMEQEKKKKLENLRKKPPFVVGIARHNVYSPIATKFSFKTEGKKKITEAYAKPNNTRNGITTATEKRLRSKQLLEKKKEQNKSDIDSLGSSESSQKVNFFTGSSSIKINMHQIGAALMENSFLCKSDFVRDQRNEQETIDSLQEEGAKLMERSTLNDSRKTSPPEITLHNPFIAIDRENCAKNSTPILQRFSDNENDSRRKDWDNFKFRRTPQTITKVSSKDVTENSLGKSETTRKNSFTIKTGNTNFIASSEETEDLKSKKFLVDDFDVNKLSSPDGIHVESKLNTSNDSSVVNSISIMITPTSKYEDVNNSFTFSITPSMNDEKITDVFDYRAMQTEFSNNINTSTPANSPSGPNISNQCNTSFRTMNVNQLHNKSMKQVNPKFLYTPIRTPRKNTLPKSENTGKKSLKSVKSEHENSSELNLNDNCIHVESKLNLSSDNSTFHSISTITDKTILKYEDVNDTVVTSYEIGLMKTPVKKKSTMNL